MSKQLIISALGSTCFIVEIKFDTIKQLQRRRATLLGRAIARNSIRDMRSKLQHLTALVPTHCSSMVRVGTLKYHDRVLVSKQCSLG